MALRSARLIGDRVLEECLEGRHRMFEGERGLPVKRVQQALIDLDRSVGPRGADGIFGSDTGAAVTAYKKGKGLQPSDPVVGSGTMRALDDDLFNDPPQLDPTFAEFSPAVADGRLEQFVALELSALLHTPLDSWRHMLGRFALQVLNSSELLGIVAQSRAIDLRERFLALADPVQRDNTSADVFFDDAVIAGPAGNTVGFTAGGERRAFIVVSDEVILGNASILRESDGTRALITLQGVAVHELTHARNLQSSDTLREIPDTDTDAFVDTAIAQARTAATGRRSAEVLRSYVREIVARHVHWIVLQEMSGKPGTLAVRELEADRLVAAALLYFAELRSVYDSNGYGREINARGDVARFTQLEKWLRLCSEESFSDIEADDNQSTLLFQAAAQNCADQVTSQIFEFPPEDGLFPLIQDFQ
jgi:hypothetical protein